MLPGKKVIIITMGNRNREGSSSQPPRREGTKGKEVKSAFWRRPLDVLKACMRANECEKKIISEFNTTLGEIESKIEDESTNHYLPEELKKNSSRQRNISPKSFINLLIRPYRDTGTKMEKQ